MRGSCLCGKCVFELSGRLSSVGKCHCSKCRKVSGTASNAVLWARPENLVWLSGSDNVKNYVMSDGWTSCFCADCGSPLPHMDVGKTKWFIPAGLLDEDPGTSVRGHIHVGSMPSWEIIGDDAPQFSEDAS